MTDGGAQPGSWTRSRPVDLVLARLHLRTGSLGLARAELEALAGSASLDDAAVLDLAEARWRTGDLAGAGDAVEAYLATGGEETMALVIAAEAIASTGGSAEARSLMGRALRTADGSIDALFAGMPRSPMWPPDHPRPGAQDAQLFVEPSLSAAGPAHEPVGAPAGEEPAGKEGGAGQLQAGRQRLDRGELETAAAHLALALRQSPALAPAVVDLVPAGRSPALDLVRGDALRLLGQESESREAFALAAAALAGSLPPGAPATPDGKQRAARRTGGSRPGPPTARR
jgi:hypothetical protein